MIFLRILKNFRLKFGRGCLHLFFYFFAQLIDRPAVDSEHSGGIQGRKIYLFVKNGVTDFGGHFACEIYYEDLLVRIRPEPGSLMKKRDSRNSLGETPFPEDSAPETGVCILNGVHDLSDVHGPVMGIDITEGLEEKDFSYIVDKAQEEIMVPIAKG